MNFDGLTVEQISARLMQGNAPLMNAMGCKGIQAHDAQAHTLRMAFEVRPEFCHSGGRIAQGGFVTAWLDAAMAHLVIVESKGRENVASLEIKVSFVAAASPGPVVAHARILKKGRRVAFLAADLYDKDERLLASATSTALLTEMHRPGA